MTGAQVSATGPAGGGRVRIGGPREGGRGAAPDDLAHARTVTIDAASRIAADATDAGDGGDVVVWSDEATSFAGLITARGGAGGGGGEAEVSGAWLDYRGLADLRAPAGATGTLLLDPSNFTISSAPASGSAGITSGANVNTTTLQDQLALGNVVLSTSSGSLLTEEGNITIASPFSWSSGFTLTLTADKSIIVNADVTIGGTGGLLLNYNTGDPTNLRFAMGASASFTGSGSLSINGNAYTLITSMAALDNIDSTGLSGRYALASDLDASPTVYSAAVVSGTFTGTFEGLGHTVSNLTISGANYTGLFGNASGATLRDVGIVDANITGGTYSGILLGHGQATISDVHTSGQLTGGVGSGGLAGVLNFSSVTGSYSTATVDGGTNSYIGGLVGHLYWSSVSDSHATGNVTGGRDVGGLFGDVWNGGSITRSYATGTVAAINDGTNAAGGLIGSIGRDNGNTLTISQSYASGAVQGAIVGGLIGDATAPVTVSDSYAVGAVTGTNGGGFAGGLAGRFSDVSLNSVYSSGAVQGQGTLGGLVGAVTGSIGLPIVAYWDKDTSGLSSSAAGTALNTATFQNGNLPTNFDSNVWATGSGLYPYLQWRFPNGVQAVTGTAYSDAGVTAAAGKTVVVDAGGLLASVTTGANGYYYAALPSGTLAYPNNFVTASSDISAARVFYSTGATVLSGNDLYGSFLAVPTPATSLSGAFSLATYKSAANSIGTGTTAQAAIAATANLGYLATGAFTIDQAVTSPLLVTTASGGALTVSSAITLSTGASLGLYSAGALSINAPITVQGAGTVGLAFAGGATNLGFASPLSYRAADGDALTASAGGKLTINGAAYTLLYSLAALDALDGYDAVNLTGTAVPVSGKYALADDFDASGTTYQRVLVGTSGGARFENATLEGLGHVVTGLTIDAGSGTGLVGLVGYALAATIRDIGLVGGSISAGGYSGALVGALDVSSSLVRSYSTASVTGNGDAVGGLVGYVGSNSSIVQSYATGAVGSSAGTGTGGLAGYLDSSSSVTQSYATGRVRGASSVGGLVGYATGSFTSIGQSYATGQVTGTSGTGGLVGTSNFATVADSYYDSDTTGQSGSAGGTGIDYGNAFAAASYGGFDFNTVWYIAEGDTRPILRSEYATTIRTAHQLQLMALDLSADYVLAADIDLGTPLGDASEVWNNATGFKPLATLSGTLDGQGHVVDGLFIDRPSNNNVGLIGVLTGSVTNIGVTDANVTGQGDTGALIGHVDTAAAVISNVFATGSVTGNGGSTGGLIGFTPAPVSNAWAAVTVTTSGSNAGGLIGYTNGSAAVTDAHAYGDVSGAGDVGGLIGHQEGGAVTRASAAGNVTDSGNSAGGLIGYASPASPVTDAYATGTVTAQGANVGGLIGYDQAALTRVYATGKVTGGGNVGGLVGVNNGGQATDAYWDSGSTGQANSGFASGASDVVDDRYALYGGFDAGTWYVDAGNTRPFLRSEASTTIYTSHQLQLMALDLSATYVLAADIDFAADLANPSEVWNPQGAGFVPVGDLTTAFSGTFDGQGHVVAGLFIDNATLRAVGLFGVASGSIANLGLTNVDITGSLSNGVGGDFLDVGALVGHSFATLSHVFVTGSVTASGNAGSTGGLAGYSNGAISDSWVVATIDGGGRDGAGGLVGYSDGGAVTRAYAGGTISGGNRLGGLIGRALNNAITDAYATANVTGGSSIGGLVGHNDGGLSLTRVYASGAVAGSSALGGLVGDGGGGALTDAYWDSGTAGSASQAVGDDGAAAAVDVAAARYNQATYTGFDFTNVWYQAEGETRPILRSEYSTSLASAHQLQLMTLDMTAAYRLAGDVDAGGTADLSDVWSAAGFVPVGGSATAFSGSLDGQGHVIDGLFINSASGYAGLFGRASGALSNIGLTDVDVTGADDIGALVGHMDGAGAIADAYATGKVTGTGNSGSTGGLAGNSAATISRSWADVTVNSGGKSNTGGLVGYAGDAITQSYATGSVTGGDNSGGLVGHLYQADLSQSYAMGPVTGANNVGGLIGNFEGAGLTTIWAISQSYATGKVTGTGNVHGLLGINAAGVRIESEEQCNPITGCMTVLAPHYYYGTISDSYYDGGTTGVVGGEGTALTTAGLQGSALPANFDAAVWATGDGLYPYLKWRFPNGVQAVSGKVYNLTGGQAAGTDVSVAAGGAALGSAYSGANGYYYVAMPAGSVAAGTDVLAYVGGIDASSLATATGASNTGSVDLVAGYLLGQTGATSLSAVPTDSAPLVTAALAAATGDAAATVAARTGIGYIATGAGFSIDQVPDFTGDFLALTGSATPLTVDAALTVPDGKALRFYAGGSLAINAPMVAQDAATVVLSYDAADPANLRFRGGASLTYSGTGGSLSINGAAYQLLYSMADIDLLDGVEAVGGTGTITTASGHYALALDLSAAGTSYGRALVGTSSNPFTGSFEGLGHSITGLAIDAGTTSNTGLFGYLSGTVRDLSLVDAAVKGGSDSGTLIGHAEGGAIVVANVAATGTVTVTGGGAGGLIGSAPGKFWLSNADAWVTVTATGDHAGGLIGYAGDGGSKVQQGRAHGTVTGASNVGGLIGTAAATFTVSDSYATGTVTGSGSDIGGLIGQSSANLTDVYASGAVGGTGSQQGGLIGRNNGGTLTAAYWDQVTTGQTASDGGTAITAAADAFKASTYAGFDLTGTWYIAEDYTRPLLRSEASISITNGHQLQLMALDLSADYVLAADFAVGALLSNASEVWNTATGFVPLGGNGNSFTGSLDGQGHVIDGLFIARNTSTVGLIGRATGATIADLTLTGVQISGGSNVGALAGRADAGTRVTGVTVRGTVSGTTTVGGLVGRSKADMSDSSAAVNVTASGLNAGGIVGYLDPLAVLHDVSASGAVTGQAYVGGLVGQSASDVVDSYAAGAVTATGLDSGSAYAGGLIGYAGGAVTDSYATGSVTGGPRTGGLVGYALATISNAHATGAVTGGDDTGGLVGYAEEAISNAYATGMVTGGNQTGGLVGDAKRAISNSFAAGTVVGRQYTGGLIGLAYIGADVTESHAYGDVSGTNDAGGLIGFYSGGTVSRSHAAGDVRVSDGSVGGLIGSAAGSGSRFVTDSYATGSVTGSGNFVGGLIGYNQAQLTRVYATGLVTPGTGSDFGGLVGANLGGAATNAYWDVQTTGQAESGLDAAEMTDSGDISGDRYALYGAFDGSAVWYVDPGKTRPILRSEYSTTIYTSHQLQLMALDLSADYVLARDIDFAADLANPSEVWNPNGAGFKPVGDVTTAFTGDFDGQGHVIDGLFIADSTDRYVGLFGAASGSIANLGLANVDVTGSLSNGVGGDYLDVGGLIGHSDATLSNVFVTGTVTGHGNAGSTGGLAGYSSGAIGDSWVVATVDGAGRDGAGGLVGYANGGAVTRAYAGGTVTGRDQVGGLFGRASNNGFTDSYATAAVTGGDSVGGLVGRNDGGLSLTQVYASGTVAGSSNLGGLVGGGGGGALANAYWDSGTAGSATQAVGDNAGATAVDVAAARYNQATYTGFDFANVWYQAEGETRPILRSEYSTSIYSAHQLQLMATTLSASYVLGGDVDAGGTADLSDVWSAAGFVPVGSSATAFSGSLDGQGHVIDGLFINSASGYAGLLGRASGALSNIGLTDVDVTGADDIGALVGHMDGAGAIADAYATGKVTGTGSGGSTGGLAGFSGATISRSWADVTVNSGGKSFAGGLVGYAGGTITQSYATGSVTGGDNSGGLVGQLYATNLSQSYAMGSVTGGDNSGGLVGNATGAMISQSYATGSVTGGDNSGGLVGRLARANLSQSYAMGPVTGANNVGGLIGNFEGAEQFTTWTISQSYATGKVAGTGNVHALVGTNTESGYYDLGTQTYFYFYGAVQDSYYDAQTAGVIGGEGTALTTAGLQGSALPANFDAAVWATGDGLYPYLKWRFPNGVQAVSGTAYAAGSLAPVAGAGVTVLGAGTAFGRTTYTGANGYYYAFGAAGTIADGTAVLAYSPSLSAAGAGTMGSGNVLTGVDLYAGYLGVSTDEILSSAAPDVSGLRALAVAGAGADAVATGLLSSIDTAVIARGASFTIDQPLSVGYDHVFVTTTGAPLTVAAAVTIPDGRKFGLISGGTLTLDAPVTALGAAGLTLGYDTGSDTNLSFASPLTYRAANGDALTTSAGGALSINGTSYTLIYSMSQLDLLDGVDAVTGAGTAAFVSGMYALADDLDAGGTTFTRAIVGDTIFGNFFNGTFDGLGHRISNLTIAAGSTDRVGLFGNVSSVTIRDIGLVDADISGGHQVGGLIGYVDQDARVTQSYVTGRVSGSGSFVGGLIGYTEGGGNRAARAWFAGAVSGDDEVGGLIGYDIGTVMTQSHAAGSVVGSGDFVGGLIGDIRSSASTITQSYATNSVTGVNRVGGLVGEASFGATITQSYATGAVAGVNFVGGLVGSNGATITDSYYDLTTSGVGGVGAGIDHADAFTASSYAGFDFGDVWYMAEGMTRPMLRSEYSTRIATAHQLQLMALDLSADYVLLGDIDAGGTALAAEVWNTANGFMQVGGSTAFTGSLDGQGHAVDGLTVIAASGDAGLFGAVYGADISDLVLTGVSVTGPAYAGALLGRDLGGTTIADVEVSGIVSAGTYGGGVAGLLRGSVTDSTADVAVTGTRGAGGLVGLVNVGGSVLRGTATGDVSGGSILGGLVGRLRGSVTEGDASGDVTGTGSYIGGLVGLAEGGTVTDGTAGGAVSGQRNIGGLLGQTDGSVIRGTATGNATGSTFVGGLVGTLYGTVSDGKASGAVAASSAYAGGLVGWASAGSAIDGATASGSVMGDAYIGGLVGGGLGTVTDSSAGGAVTGGRDVGGLMGMAGGTINGVHASGAVTGTRTSIGGLIGTNHAMVDDAYATGAVTGGQRYTGGLIGLSDGAVTDVQASGEVTGTSYAGGLIGYTTAGGSVTGGHAYGAVMGSEFVGGLIGRAGGGAVAASHAEGAVTGSGDHTGGLIGYAGTASPVTDAYAMGAVTGDGLHTGGLIGTNRAVLTNVYSVGAVTGTGAGGLVGSNSGGSASGAYWDMGTSGMTVSALGTGITGAAAFAGATYAGYDFGTVWFMLEGDTRPVLRGEAQATIFSAQQLAMMAFDPTADYVLARDIDFGDATAWNPDGSGFLPVGNALAAFTGSLDGQGHVITGLTIDRGANAGVGLFGVVDGSARIADLTLVDLDVTGGDDTGGLIGRLEGGTVSGVHVYGTVAGAAGAGGLIGRITGGDVEFSHAGVAVRATGDGAGGLIGAIDGPVSTVENAYATGSVTGTNAVGGLVGINSGDLASVYASGAVSGTGATLGGLVGDHIGGLLIAAFYDADTTGQGGAGTAIVNADAFTAASYGGFDVTNTWYLDPGKTRPMLRNEYSTSLSNAHQLQLMVLDLAADYALVGDIDAAGTADASEVWNGATGFVPVGDSTNAFTGTLDGQGHGIDGLTVADWSGDAGLFGIADGADLSDLALTDVSIAGSGYAGGLLGRDQGGTKIVDVTVSGIVSAGTYGGGVAGLLRGSVTDSTADVAVTGTRGAGGLVGLVNTGGTVTGGTATGAVDGGSILGGLVGRLRGSVTDGVASGDVTGTGGYVGGLVGLGEGAAITTSTASGAVEGARNIGGLVGQMDGTIDGSTASGAVTGQSFVGGLVGTLAGMASDSTAFGDVTGTGSYVGGLVGWALAGSTIDDATAGGAVDGDAYVGGLVGGAFGTITASAASGAVGGNRDVGGAIGYLDGAASGVTASGDTIARVNSAGGLVGYGTAASSIKGGIATGDVTAPAYGGGLVGEMYGQVSRAYAAGSVQADQDAGGLVGRLGGTVIESFAEGAVVSGRYHTGGLVGYGTATSRIEDSYATSAVWTIRYGGGLVGRMRGAVDGAVASGLVHAGNGTAGGLFGQLESMATVTDAYWNTESSGQAAGVGVGTQVGQGLTTAALRASLPSGLDGSLWGQVAGTSDPYLKWRFAMGPMMIGGTATAGSAVSLALAGASAGTVVTGADGRFSFMVDPQPIGDTALAWYMDWHIVAASGVQASSVEAGAAAEIGATGTSGLALTDGRFQVETGLGSLAALSAALADAAGDLDGPAALFKATGGDLAGAPDITIGIHGTAPAFALGGTLSTRSLGTVDLVLDGANARFDFSGTIASEATGYAVVIEAPRIFDLGGSFNLAPGGYYLIYGGIPAHSSLAGLGTVASLDGATRADTPPGEGVTASLQNWLVWAAAGP